MKCRTKRLPLPAVLLGLAFFVTLDATETENLGLRILPAPGKVVVDAKFDDWDLAGGVFACGDVENLRDRLACWFHLMYDKDRLYLLARWIDETPLNNPGSVAGDMGFAGDCLQVRTITNPDDPKQERTAHLTAWRDRDGKDVVDTVWGRKFNEGSLKDAKTQGGRQAFAANTAAPTSSGKAGYVQEMSIPWDLLAREGFVPKPGSKMVITVEPNFGTEAKFRVTIKDLFKPGETPDRVFTFMASRCWGYGTFMDKGHVEPQPLRLADNREFKVGLEEGVPVIDWTGLFQEKRVEGFAKLRFTMPDDGYVSLNIKSAQGTVARQLLTGNFFTKGEQEVLWDGLTNLSHTKPGEVVAAGDYEWEAIWHKGIGLRLIGWAHNGGKAPFDSPGGNWGGDMGNPCTVDTDGQRLFLGWSGSEAGKAVVCTDLNGKVLWRQKRGGFGGAVHLCVDSGVVYVNDRQKGENVLYRLSAAKGDYVPWQGTDDAVLNLKTLLEALNPDGQHEGINGLDAADGKLFVSYGPGNVVVVADAATGKQIKALKVDSPGDIEFGPKGELYVISAGSRVLRVDVESGEAESVVADLQNAAGLSLDAEGNLYVGVRDPDNQVKVFSKEGKLTRTIGKSGGRPVLGKWQQDGMRFVQGLQIDKQGKLWVMESDGMPRRVSVWDGKTGAFVREFFGPTNYGAGGGAICPIDPLTMVGQGCEWELDPETGRASCIAVFHRGGMNNSRFGVGADGRVYVAVGGDWHGYHPVHMYERVSAGEWKLRTALEPLTEKNRLTGLRVWADANGDQERQDGETRDYETDLGGWVNGWYLPMTQNLTFYGGKYRIAVTGYTACGAPLYDLTKAKEMPVPEDLSHRGGMGAQRGCGSEDGRLVVYNGHYGADHSDFRCYDVETGQLRWTYPNTYVGVHGGHRAPPPEVGLIRAAYDVVGSVKLPEPVGNIFVIPTDKGEWHILTGDGYYLTRLFESDPMKVQWPDPAAPGAIMDNTPPGMGAEDFGGSIAASKDGQLYVQAGKTAFINLKVVGLDTVKKLGAGRLTVSEDDLRLAAGFREKLLQAAVGTRQALASKKAVTFSGDLRRDFGIREPIRFAKGRSTVEAAVAYDDANLYLGWSVQDATPWVNGASEPAAMYASGDTVDFQLATDPQVDKKRREPVLGDLRLSIGNLKGKATAVVYRPIAKEKRPRKFFSGTVKDGYEVQSVVVLENARIEVKVNKGKSYVVEAAIPLTALGLKPAPQLKVSADLGVTYGDPAGSDTVLRNYWNNQATGIVADEVWELKLEPKNWGELVFE